MSPKTPFDVEALNGLYGAETVRELLQMTVDEAAGLLVEIADGATVHDSQKVQAAAHQLKGLALTMTINEFADLSKAVEQAARTESWDEIAALQKPLEVEFQAVKEQVARVIAQ